MLEKKAAAAAAAAGSELGPPTPPEPATVALMWFIERKWLRPSVNESRLGEPGLWFEFVPPIPLVKLEASDVPIGPRSLLLKFAAWPRGPIG